ncbi:MAG TPA: hypothetical protein VH796_17405 [Nitrososphaeraceae archaeon]
MLSTVARKIEAYNKIVKNEFLALEDIPDVDDDKLSKICLSSV